MAEKEGRKWQNRLDRSALSALTPDIHIKGRRKGSRETKKKVDFYRNSSFHTLLVI